MRVASRWPLLLLAACVGTGEIKGINTAPEAVLVGPDSRSVYNLGATIELRGEVEDLQEAPADLRVSWRSDLDGGLAEGVVPGADGEVVFTTSTLSAGVQTLRLVVEDSEGAEGQATVTIGIIDPQSDPTITFVQPES